MMMIPPIVGVFSLPCIMRFKVAWSNSGRSPILSRTSLRMTRGPSAHTMAKATSTAAIARHHSSP